MGDFDDHFKKNTFKKWLDKRKYKRQHKERWEDKSANDMTIQDLIIAQIIVSVNSQLFMMGVAMMMTALFQTLDQRQQAKNVPPSDSK